MHQHRCPPTPLPSLLSRREAGVAILGLVGAHLVSCGPVRPPRVTLGGKGSATRLTIASPRIDAVPGRMLVIPVEVSGQLPGSFRPRLALTDGREIKASLIWIGVETDTVGLSGWLPRATRWVVTPVSEGAIPASVGAWHVVAHLPLDAAGQTLRLGDRAVPVNWLAVPEDLSPGVDSSDQHPWDPWRAPEHVAEPDASLLAPEWRNPLLRWRAKLATGKLGLPSSRTSPWLVRGDPAVLEGLAELHEARWCIGLARLWYADPRACGRLTARLARTVEFSTGRGVRHAETIATSPVLETPSIFAPAWPTQQHVLDSLLADLLDPAHTGDALASRSDAWIDALPGAATWIADDAAALVGTESEPLVQLRAACLVDKPMLMWVTGRDGFRVGEPQTLVPGSISEVLAATGLGVPMTGASGFAVRCGNHQNTLTARDVRQARPPGVTCGPLLYDWTLEAWAASQPRAGARPNAAWTAGVLVYRDETTQARAFKSGSSADASGWAAFVECAGPTQEQPSGTAVDQLGLWFGQRGASAAVLHISRDGTLRDERHPEETTTLDVVEQGSRWSVSVPIPRRALEPGGILRLGLVRRDPRGIRTAWPRRLLPWDHEPVRAAIDLNAWSGLE